MAGLLGTMGTLGKVVQVATLDSYPAQLKLFYGINAALKKEGISAPQEASLENTRKLYNILGRPLDAIPTLHVGGTNGKGTTSFKLSHTLKSHGIKTGLFVSPHLASFRERIQVDEELLPEESFVSSLQAVLQLCKENQISATEFEVTFLMAVLHFQQSKCEAVVLEVGLGGEWDATNVIDSALAIICSVSLDHTRILGSTVEAIASNKAGIFKPGKPALVGPGVPMGPMTSMAQARGAQLYTYEDARAECQPTFWNESIEFGCNDNTTGLSLSPLVNTDALNSNIALLGMHLLKKHCGHMLPQLTAQSLSSESTRDAIATRPPCRWEKHSRVVSLGEKQVTVECVLDVGHNPAAMAALTRRVSHDYPSRCVHIVYAMSRDKDVRTCLKSVITAVPHDRIHFVQSGNFRAVSRAELNVMFKEETGNEMTGITGKDIPDTLEQVMQRAAEGGGDSGGVVVICGTGYIMPEARAFLGIIEPRDYIDLNRNDSL